ncbi:MAG: glycosyltransferase [Gammaproteobacteria bacterium]|nr:glycosyltransferase [Gammaproteobacteria bacterium]
MTEPRALQLCPNDHPPFLELCRVHAKALTIAGFQVDTVFLAPPRGLPDIDAHYLDVAGGSLRMALALTRHLADRRYALTVAHRYRALRVAVAARRTHRLGRIICIAHEYGLFERFRRRLWQRMLARDVMFAGVSAPVAAQMLEQQPSLAPVAVLPNAIDLDAFDAALLARAEARRQLNLPSDACLVAVVGRLHAKKRPELALRGFEEAFAALPPNAHLVFVGEGEERATLERSIAHSTLEGCVTLTGAVPGVARYFAAFDLLLATSSEAEAFGMVLLEAMAARLPILCADVPGPRSVLGHDGAYFADVHDLAAKLIDATTQGAGHQRDRLEENFTAAGLAQRYRELLDTRVRT